MYIRVWVGVCIVLVPHGSEDSMDISRSMEVLLE